MSASRYLALRTTIRNFDAAARLCVRTAVSRSLFPSGSVLPSTVSAKGKPSLFDGFVGTMTLSDFSSTYMFIVRFMPS